MYQFTSQTPGLVVCLHDEAGNRIGAAPFATGRWATDDPVLAAALVRVLPTLREFNVQAIAAPAPVAPAVPEQAAPAAAPQPVKAPRRSRRQKKG